MSGPAASGEFSAEFEVFAVGLFGGRAEGLDLLPMLALELVDLAGQGEDDGVGRVGAGRGWRRVGPGRGARCDGVGRGVRRGTRGRRLYLQAPAPRVSCPRHGVIVAAVPWARHGSRFSSAFEDTVAWLACHAAVTVLAALLRITWRSAAADPGGR